MRRFLALLLIFSLFMGGLVALPSQAFADQGRDKKIPPGLAKKFSLDLEKLWGKDWDDLFAELEKRIDKDQNKLVNIKFLTRSQVAYILAERSSEFEVFNKEEEILAKVVDKGAIPSKYRKAVAYVISADLMTYKKLPNGKINFQPNKAASLADLNWLTKINDGFNNQYHSQFSGTVRFIYTIGSKIWLTIETAEGILRTAYFTSDVFPSGLGTGTFISVKVQGYKIIESSLTSNWDAYPYLTLTLQTNTTPRVNQAVYFTPQLTNKSGSSISLQNVLYRFGIKKVGSNTEILFTGSSTMSMVVPALNSSSPLTLVVPTTQWIPASAGNYIITRAELRENSGEWHAISYQQPTQSVNLLSVNQSNIESSTSGFSPYGNDTYAGATLTRDTTDKWQGEASLRVLTNGYNPWQGVNVAYSGSGVTGTLTYSFYIKAPSGVPLRAKIFDNTNNTYPSGGTLEFLGTGYWERKAVTFTPTASTSDLSLQVTLNNNTTSTVYWLDGLQLEQGSSATGWIPGGSTNNGVLTVIE